MMSQPCSLGASLAKILQKYRLSIRDLLDAPTAGAWDALHTNSNLSQIEGIWLRQSRNNDLGFIPMHLRAHRVQPGKVVRIEGLESGSARKNSVAAQQ